MVFARKHAYTQKKLKQRKTNNYIKEKFAGEMLARFKNSLLFKCILKHYSAFLVDTFNTLLMAIM